MGELARQDGVGEAGFQVTLRPLGKEDLISSSNSSNNIVLIATTNSLIIIINSRLERQHLFVFEALHQPGITTFKTVLLRPIIASGLVMKLHSPCFFCFPGPSFNGVLLEMISVFRAKLPLDASNSQKDSLHFDKVWEWQAN